MVCGIPRIRVRGCHVRASVAVWPVAFRDDSRSGCQRSFFSRSHPSLSVSSLCLAARNAAGRANLAPRTPTARTAAGACVTVRHPRQRTETARSRSLTTNRPAPLRRDAAAGDRRSPHPDGRWHLLAARRAPRHARTAAARSIGRCTSARTAASTPVSASLRRDSPAAAEFGSRPMRRCSVRPAVRRSQAPTTNPARRWTRSRAA